MAKRSRRHRPKPKSKPSAKRTAGAAPTGESSIDEPTTQELTTGTTSTEQPATVAPATEPAANQDHAVRAARAALRAKPLAPAFWFGFEVPWCKLVIARFALFTVLAIDAVTAVSHAPRYDANGFNVAQVSVLDALGAGRVSYEVGQLICAYALMLVAFGVATRVLLPMVAVLYAWLYFGSQIDGYQHHYLVALLLGLACFVPWQRPPSATPKTPVRSWALRLILVQLAIMYLWAAISKLDTAWLDGSTLTRQLSGPLRWVIEHTLGIKAIAVLTVITELVLAATIWSRRWWPLAAPLGIAFHIQIAVGSFDIGLFAFVMFALYVLVVPDRIWLWLANQRAARELRTSWSWIERTVAGRMGSTAAALAVAIGIGIGIALAAPFEHALAVGLATVVVPLAIAVARWRSTRSSGADDDARDARRQAVVTAVAHVIALALWLIVNRIDHTAADYYKRWGRTASRFESEDHAERAYRRLTEVAPREPVGHYQLGTILLRRNRGDDGLRELHQAQRLELRRARAWIAEARWLATNGDNAGAIEKAREATWAEPDNASARSLLDRLSRGAPAVMKEDPGDDP